MSGGSVAPAAPEQPGLLFAVLGAARGGLYVEVAPAGAQASGLAAEFAQAGWRGVQLAMPEGGADIDALLAGAGIGEAHWLALRGNGAMRALEHWAGGACRPLVVLADAGPLSLAPAPWRDALARNGYLFAASDDGCHYFVRGDQAVLQGQLAEGANLAWRTRLQASRSALAQARREAEQARSALQAAQAKGTAANARAAMLQQQIDAIYASASWQSIRALRWAGRLRREPVAALRQLLKVGRARLGSLLRTLLARLAAKAKDSPGLRRRIAPLMARHPRLARRLKAMLRPDAALANAMAPVLPPAIDPNNVVGPQFKTLLLEELGRGLPPRPQ